jgi:hypothetical protein
MYFAMYSLAVIGLISFGSRARAGYSIPICVTPIVQHFPNAALVQQVSPNTRNQGVTVPVIGLRRRDGSAVAGVAL